VQLLPAAEGIMPSGQGRQKGEAAVAKEPTGHGVQPEDGRPLKPRTTKERTIARSLVACAIIRETNFARCSETTLNYLNSVIVRQLQRRLAMECKLEVLHARVDGDRNVVVGEVRD
jgi:hypothetical protein